MPRAGITQRNRRAKISSWRNGTGSLILHEYIFFPLLGGSKPKWNEKCRQNYSVSLPKLLHTVYEESSYTQESNRN